MPKTWGYVLDAPGRPSADEQRRALAILGVDLGEFGTCFADRIVRGSTRPRSQLAERNDLLSNLQAGDTVVIAAPFCLGLSPADAEWFLGELAVAGASAIINGDLLRIEPGADVSAVVAAVRSAQNVHHSRTSKARARKSK